MSAPLSRVHIHMFNVPDSPTVQEEKAQIRVSPLVLFYGDLLYMAWDEMGSV